MTNTYTLERPTSAPSLYSTDGNVYESKVVDHYFLPGTNADWYVLEYDATEDIVFGWAEVIPGCGELGTSSVLELQSLEIAVPIKINGELNFIPSKVEFDQH